MQALTGLLWSLVLLVIAIASLARIVGWRELEALAVRTGVAFLMILFGLPILLHGVGSLLEGGAPRSSTSGMPEVIVVGPDHLVVGGLMVVGHVAMALWWLRRRARGEHARAEVQERNADRRRERGRLPPRDLDGGAP